MQIDGVRADADDEDERLLQSPKVDNEVSRALEDQQEMPDFDSVGSRGSSKLAKVQGGNKKHLSVLQGFEYALGDSQENAKKAESDVPKKAVVKGHLPGVNAYSWWSNKSAKIAAKKAQVEILSQNNKKRHLAI